MDVRKENVSHLLCNLSLNIRFNEGTEYSFLSLYYQEFSDLYCWKHNYIDALEAYGREDKMFSMEICFVLLSRFFQHLTVKVNIKLSS